MSLHPKSIYSIEMGTVLLKTVKQQLYSGDKADS